MTSFYHAYTGPDAGTNINIQIDVKQTLPGMASDADLFKYDQGTSRRYFHAWKLSVLSGSELVVYRPKQSNQFLNG